MAGKLFGKVSSKRLSKAISISSPKAFAASIYELKKGGVTLKEKRALVAARNVAAAQLKRKGLSPRERSEFALIANMKLPAVKRGKKRR